MEARKYNELLKLSPEDKLELIELLWDDLSENPDNIPLTEAQKKELDYRLEKYKKNPAGVQRDLESQ